MYNPNKPIPSPKPLSQSVREYQLVVARPSLDASKTGSQRSELSCLLEGQAWGEVLA